MNCGILFAFLNSVYFDRIVNECCMSMNLYWYPWNEVLLKSALRNFLSDIFQKDIHYQTESSL